MHPSTFGRYGSIAFAVIAAVGIVCAAPARAQDAIRIGEINSYKAQPAFLDPTARAGSWRWSRSTPPAASTAGSSRSSPATTAATPGDAVRVAEELLSREKVDLLAGGFLSNIGLALTDFAKQKKVLFLASEPLTDKIVWQNGNRYTFRLRSSTYMQTAMLVPEAAKANKKRWAIVYPNYEYGQSAAATFKEQLKKLQPDVRVRGRAGAAARQASMPAPWSRRWRT